MVEYVVGIDAVASFVDVNMAADVDAVVADMTDVGAAVVADTAGAGAAVVVTAADVASAAVHDARAAAVASLDFDCNLETFFWSTGTDGRKRRICLFHSEIKTITI